MRAPARPPAMEPMRIPPTVGTVVALSVAGLLVLPYVALEAGAAAVATYYGFGPMSALVVLILALVTAVVFASGRQGRADPSTAAGTALGLGVVATALAVAWALSVPESFVFGLTTREWIEYHRWSVVGATATTAGCGVWYAYALGLL